MFLDTFNPEKTVIYRHKRCNIDGSTHGARLDLVSTEEIEKVAKLMKIELSDHSEHIDRVQKMLDYFDILDKAGVAEQELVFQELSIDQLREDKHVRYPDKLITKINNHKGTYVRAPKMV